MISVYKLKPGFQALLRPTTNGLAKIGVSANQVTTLAMLMSIAYGVFIFYYGQETKWLLLLPLLLFIRMALNAIDGMLAREHHMKSNLGAILNELGDVISDTALYLPFVWIAGFSAPLVLAIVFLAALTEMTGIIGIQIGASRRYDGPMGKSDRALFFGLIALLLGFEVPIHNWIVYLESICIFLLLWTIYNRASNALKEAS